MNGVHDMGGMEGLGTLRREENEPVFHADWERRILGLTLAVAACGKWNNDASRHARERIPGPDYLRMSYYEKWLAGLRMLLVESGLVTPAELRSGRPAPDAVKADPPLTAEGVGPVLAKGSPVEREIAAEPRFRVGQSVRARNLNPGGHTRLPRYARGKEGVIARRHGAHVLPDSNAHFQGERPQHLYSVHFDARALWGPDASARDVVYIDLWESYLEPV
jgi:nitrile hydratase